MTLEDGLKFLKELLKRMSSGYVARKVNCFLRIDQNKASGS